MAKLIAGLILIGIAIFLIVSPRQPVTVGNIKSNNPEKSAIYYGASREEIIDMMGVGLTEVPQSILYELATHRLDSVLELFPLVYKGAKNSYIFLLFSEKNELVANVAIQREVLPPKSILKDTFTSMHYNIDYMLYWGRYTQKKSSYSMHFLDSDKKSKNDIMVREEEALKLAISKEDFTALGECLERINSNTETLILDISMNKEAVSDDIYYNYKVVKDNKGTIAVAILVGAVK